MSPAEVPERAPEQAPAARPPDAGEPAVLPVQSREDTDSAWGERPEADEDDRFYRDRPPHWDSE